MINKINQGKLIHETVHMIQLAMVEAYEVCRRSGHLPQSLYLVTHSKFGAPRLIYKRPDEIVLCTMDLDREQDVRSKLLDALAAYVQWMIYLDIREKWRLAHRTQLKNLQRPMKPAFGDPQWVRLRNALDERVEP